MSINRNNYEEFLLLYIDGELTIQQQKEVEFFINQHTDIKQEFNDLLNTKLKATDVYFGDISTLLKDEKASINLNNYQEHFLLFVDNELSKENKHATETFVLQHPALQNEFTTLQQTKLPIETIECPSKEELYKKERKPIVFYLQRLAVAAVFIGFGAFVYNLFSTNKKTETIVVAPKNSEQKVNTTISNQQKNAASIVLQKEAVTVNSVDANLNKKTAAVLAKKIVTDIKNTEEKKIENIVTNNTPVTLVKQENVLINNNALVNNNTVSINKPTIQNTQIASIVENNQQPTTNNATVAIIYKTLDVDDEDNTTIQKKTSKLKGFLKKAAKMITPNETSDDESKKLFAVTL